MDEFETLRAQAREELRLQGQADAQRAIDQDAALSVSLQTQRETEILRCVVSREALVIAHAALNFAGVSIVRGVLNSDVSMANSKFWKPSKAPGQRTQGSIKRRERRSAEYIQARSFSLWDLEVEHAEHGQSEPFETYGEHYLLGRDGSLYYSTSTGSTIRDSGHAVVKNFELNWAGSSKLETVRLGLAKLVERNHLDVNP